MLLVIRNFPLSLILVPLSLCAAAMGVLLSCFVLEIRAPLASPSPLLAQYTRNEQIGLLFCVIRTNLDTGRLHEENTKRFAVYRMIHRKMRKPPYKPQEDNHGSAQKIDHPAWKGRSTTQSLPAYCRGSTDERHSNLPDVQSPSPAPLLHFRLDEISTLLSTLASISQLKARISCVWNADREGKSRFRELGTAAVRHNYWSRYAHVRTPYRI